jgi:hypothetical protein
MTVVKLTSSSPPVFSDYNHGVTFVKVGWYFEVRRSGHACIDSTGKVKFRAVTGAKKTAYPFLVINFRLDSWTKFG